MGTKMAQKVENKLNLSWKEMDDDGLDAKIKGLSDEEATAITHLYIQRNKLTTIPGSISRLSNLKLVDASHNQITQLSQPFSKLTKVHTVYLQGNSLEDVPRELKSLPELEVLWLEENEALAGKAVNIGKPFHEDRAAVKALFS